MDNYDITETISIHSLRAEGDGGQEEAARIAAIISIHSLRAEGDIIISPVPAGLFQFQSTPSVRRETIYHAMPIQQAIDFNPLPPCGGRQ